MGIEFGQILGRNRASTGRAVRPPWIQAHPYIRSVHRIGQIKRI